ncbi:MAG: winged helix-turn-helix transcriptional regulator [Nitrosomonas sp.]|nr:winged helix-turn-helix transcriptional regulator [Nitrosomonas sp.]
MNSESMKTDLGLPDVGAVRKSASQACAILKALANEDRLLILCQLSQGARNVGELEALLDIHQPTLSQQLTVLREEGLVATERQGKYIYYSLASMEAMRIMRTLFDLYCGQHSENE